MCYVCKIYCDKCTPKFVYCKQCGDKNLLVEDRCFRCGAAITDEMKDEARRIWAEQHQSEGSVEHKTETPSALSQ